MTQRLFPHTEAGFLHPWWHTDGGSPHAWHRAPSCDERAREEQVHRVVPRIFSSHTLEADVGPLGGFMSAQGSALGGVVGGVTLRVAEPWATGIILSHDFLADTGESGGDMGS